MKRLKLFFLILVILLISGCSKNSYMEEINYDEYNKLIENKETFILEVMRESCTHCESLKPKLEEVASEYNIKIKYINLDAIKNKKDLDDFCDKTTDGTPTIIFYKDGEENSVANRIVGSVTKQKLIDKFKDMDYIK